jgi:hypothetical protein
LWESRAGHALELMASICLSAAPILRCPSFDALQNELFIIPPALELIFSSSLLFSNWRDHKSVLLVTAEAWAYFALALLDFLSHLLPAVRDSLSTFRIVDISLAALSFLPLFFYSLFLYIFTTTQLIDTLPSRFHLISKLMLVFFIPSIISLNEISSFIGISYRGTFSSFITLILNPSSLSPLIHLGTPTLSIGFNDPHDKSLWTFFTSLTLALTTAYQALNFCFAFFRIAKAFIVQRRIETTSSDQAYFFKGIAWIAGGLKLGAIETVIGFAQGGFGGALTRRILRFLSRAFLCIGIIKGSVPFTSAYSAICSPLSFSVDRLEDFEMVRQEMTQRKRAARTSNLRALIGNPRFSTFQQLTPTATQFHRTPRAFDDQPRAEQGLQAMDQLSSLRNPRDRVTIHFTGSTGAPSLHMRFSALNLPSPTVIVDSVKSNPVSPVRQPYTASVYTVDPVTAARTPIYARHTRAMSEYSYGGSVSSFTALTSQFPTLLPRVTEKTEDIPVSKDRNDPYPSTARSDSALHRDNSTSTVSRSGSFKRKPVPAFVNIDPFGEDPDEVYSPLEPVPPIPAALQEARSAPSYKSVDTVSSPQTNISGYTSQAGPVGSVSSATTPDNEDPFRYDDGQPMPLSGKSLPSRASGMDFDMLNHHRSLSQPATLAYIPEGQVDTSAVTQYQKPGNVGRIKSVGKAPRRSTPKPVQGGMTRGSVYIQPIVIPQRGVPEVELIQGDVESPYQ